ncbi:MGDG synthase family glycosyltransferase [Oceanobacillus halophilus]|uniref:Diacylglycerol glucosyltransferase N-terminal domain-containing protein n=1 Tax=Oceanobacillus halophilus TaxID=930130 RepID=A0A494ZTW7_9BACI|nr:hypothetical protein [Oceanobacillus halophilus]RKQ29671.1 hypothetical protein D8M06_17215 [Oceanobacillus halophilus]
MIRILFMPLLNIPSGHHHVADSIIEQLEKTEEFSTEIHCEKLEILSFCFGKLESFVSSLYLFAIHKLPNIYSQIYRTAAVKGEKKKHYSLYKSLFTRKIMKILKEKNPNIIICTHALPSFLLDDMKQHNHFSGTIINVYTDYFINDLWGKEFVDYHFVPCSEIKQELIQGGIKESRILVTGIPVHPIFKNQQKKKEKKEPFKVLISGGNMGAGSIEKLIRNLDPSGDILYYVLCGKNKALYDKIKQLNHPSILTLSYLKSKVEMNQWYEEVDAIITKPGGVTISECLWKKLPIFVYEALPGQEEYNLNYLIEKDLIFPLKGWKTTGNIEKTILRTLNNTNLQQTDQLKKFHQHLDTKEIPQIIKQIAQT